jgi:hypothetical protein
VERTLETTEENLVGKRLIGGLVLTSLLIIGLCLGGCGSSSSSATTPSAAAISKADFVAEGNAICVKGEQAQEAETEAYVHKHNLENKRPTKAEQSEMVNSIFAPNIQSQIDAVKALGAPSGEEQRVASAIEISQQTLDKAKANPSLFFSNENLFAAAGKQLHALGLAACAPNS